MRQKTDAEVLEEAKADFRKFLFIVWKFLGLPAPTPVQYEIAEYLQYGPKRAIIEAFRGVGKSWITSAFVVWCLWNNPEEKILVVSASKQRADDFSTFTLRLIKEIPFLQHLAPRPDQRESKIAFDVGPCRPAHAPSVKSVGIYGQMTGSRATRIIADDVENAQNSLTQDMREKLLRAVSEFEAIIMPTIGRVTFLGTPQTEESIYNKLREKGYECRIWPARFPHNSEVYMGALAPSLVKNVNKLTPGMPTDPKRFTDLDLMEREASYGRSGFALQFMLDTSLSDAHRYPLKTSDCIVTGVHPDKAPIAVQWATSPELQIRDIANIGFTGDRWYRPMYVDNKWTEYEGSVMAIDPSGRGSDELAYAIVNQLHGVLYVMDVGGLKGGYTEMNLVKLARLAKLYSVNHVVIEANFGDGMFTSLIKPVLQQYHPCSVEEVKHSIQKEKRIIDTLEPVLNQHRMVFNEELVRKDVKEATESDAPYYSLFYQMTRLTKDRGSLRHDDRLDALAIAVAYWVQAMARVESKAVQSWRQKQLDKELKVFMQHCTTSPFSTHKVKAKKPSTWV